MAGPHNLKGLFEGQDVVLRLRDGLFRAESGLGVSSDDYG